MLSDYYSSPLLTAYIEGKLRTSLEACLQALNREEFASEVCDHGSEHVNTFPCKSVFLTCVFLFGLIYILNCIHILVPL